MSDQDKHEETLAEGSLISHLLELRDRLLKAVMVVGVLFVPLAFFSNQLFTLVARPLLDKLPAGTSMVSTSLTAPFMTPIKLALLAAVFIGMPYVLYQAWAFVAPGLYKREKRFAIPMLVSSIVLFYSGAAFAYFIVFPLMFAFLTTTTPEGVVLMADMSNYLDFVSLLFFAFGAAFEIPVATVLLVSTGLVELETMTRNRGYVLIGIFIVAAFLTPPDAISQCFMAIPMYLLYEFGIIFSKLLLKERLAERAKEQEQHTA